MSGPDWATIAPYAASCVALTVGVVGPVVAARASRRMMLAHRSLADEERLWQRRADLYVDLLQWAGEQRTADTPLIDEPPAMVEYARGFRMPTDLGARMAAFASGSVYGAAMHFIEAVRDSILVNADLLATASTSSADEVQALTKKAETAALNADSLADRLAQQISDDLHGLTEDDRGRTYVGGGTVARPGRKDGPRIFELKHS